jgi:type IV pilus assembly protein PilC
MPKFSYKAFKQGGEKYDGVLEAPNKFALYDQVKKEGGTVFSATEVKKKSMNLSFKMPSFLARVKMADKVAFAKNLGSMIEAGLPLTRALSVIQRQSRSVKLKEVTVALSENINRGGSLSTAMSEHPETFSQLFISMVKSGEESGSLTKSLKAVGSQLEKSYLLTKKIRGAMLYPAIVISIMILIGIAMLIYVVPTLTATFKDLNITLPLSTRSIIFVSEFLKNHYLLSFLLFAFVVGGTIWFKRSVKGKRFFDTVYLHLPIISQIVKEVNSARTARTLSALLSAGVDFLVAIRITGEVVQNSYYKAVLKTAEANVEKGKPISEVFIAEGKLYPVFVGEMVSIGEETGKISEMLENVAVFYEEEVEQKTKDMSTIIEPVLMVFIGIAVGFFAVSMLQPIYGLVDAI